MERTQGGPRERPQNHQIGSPLDWLRRAKLILVNQTTDNDWTDLKFYRNLKIYLMDTLAKPKSPNTAASSPGRMLYFSIAHLTWTIRKCKSSKKHKPTRCFDWTLSSWHYQNVLYLTYFPKKGRRISPILSPLSQSKCRVHQRCQ